MKEAPTTNELVYAQTVFDFLSNSPMGVTVPVQTVADTIGLSYQETVIGMHWAQRTICPRTGIYLSSKRGRSGGYFVTNDRDEAMSDEVRWLCETWTHLQKNRAKTLTRKRAKLGTRSVIREIEDALNASIITVENALAKGGRYIGHVTDDE